MGWTRVAAVTAGLIAAGGVFGTFAGMIVLGAWLVADGAPADELLHPAYVLFSAVFGGGLGAVLGPLAVWVLMRHVPLGLAVGGTTLGTLVAGGMALLATGDPVLAMCWGVAGFGASAVGLRVGVPRERRLPGS